MPARMGATTGDRDTRRPFAGVPVVAGLTLMSRVLGLARDAATAAVFGAGPVLDAFTVAFRLPNLARRLLGEGALSAALLPALVSLREERGDAAADGLASVVVGRLAIGLGAAGLTAAAVLTPLALGAGGLSGEWRSLCGLTAACAPLAGFTCVAAQLSAALHARGRFAAAAFCPVLLNLFWLAGVAVAAAAVGAGGARGTAIYAVAAAVTVAGAAQVAFLLFALRRAGFGWRWDVDGTRAAVAGVRAAVLPVLLGLSVTQFNALLDGLLAWGLAAPAGDPGAELLPGVGYPLEPGAASRLYFAQRLYQFPVGVFGVAVGTVLFPRFAAAASSPGGGGRRLEEEVKAGLRSVLFVGLPASAGLMLTVDLLTAVLLGRGAFDAADAAATASAAAALGAGAWAGCGLSVAARACYAAGDRRTPVVVGVWAVGANLVLNAALVWPLGVTGLAAAGAAATCGQCVGLVALLGRAVPGWRAAGLSGAAVRAAVGAGGAAAGCVAARWGCAWAGLPAAVELAAAVAAAVAVFLPLSRGLGMTEVWELLGGGDRKESSRSPPAAPDTGG